MAEDGLMPLSGRSGHTPSLDGQELSCSFLDLAPELVRKVMEYCDFLDVCHLELTSTYFRYCSSYLRGFRIWRRLFERDFPLLMGNAFILDFDLDSEYEEGERHRPDHHMKRYKRRYRNIFLLKRIQEIHGRDFQVAMKFSIVGERGVGKKSFMARAKYGANQHLGQGANIASLVCKKYDVGGIKVNLSLFSTGGLEDFRPNMTPALYRNAQSVIIMFDCTDPTSQELAFDRWLSEIRNMQDSGNLSHYARITFLGNKTDRLGDQQAIHKLNFIRMQKLNHYTPYGEDAANGVPPADLAAILGHPAPGATAENGEQSSALPAGEDESGAGPSEMIPAAPEAANEASTPRSSRAGEESPRENPGNFGSDDGSVFNSVAAHASSVGGDANQEPLNEAKILEFMQRCHLEYADFFVASCVTGANISDLLERTIRISMSVAMRENILQHFAPNYVPRVMPSNPPTKTSKSCIVL